MAILQLDLWGNPVSVPEKEESAKGSGSSAKQETFDASTVPPTFPLFKEEEGIEPISPYKTSDDRIVISPETTATNNITDADIKTDIVDTKVSIASANSNNDTNKNEHALKEGNNERTTIIQPKPSDSTDKNETIPESSKTDENRVVYSDTQILVKLKGRPKGSTNQEIVKKDAITYSSVNTPGKRGRKSFKEIDGSVDLVNVPDDDTLKKKLYHGISEVADWFGVNNSQIRYWENEFDVLKPRKTRKGDRLFRFEDVKTLQLIHHLLRNRKFSVEGAKEYLKANKQQADIHFELTQSLNKFRSFLIELKSNLGV